MRSASQAPTTLVAIALLSACGGGSHTLHDAGEQHIEELLVACERGEMSACATAHGLYQTGGPAELDARRAAVFDAACDEGDPVACSLSGHFVGHGHVSTADPTAAITRYRSACDGGYGLGCLQLGREYAAGGLVESDLERAAGLYHQSCAAGHGGGCLTLGMCQLRGECAGASAEVAVRSFLQGCELGDAASCNGACWYGSLTGQADEVADACDAAVLGSPPAQESNYMDSRGLNRALRGDIESAIWDFEAYAKNKPDDQLRRRWIEQLANGGDPFDEQMLDTLLRH